MGWKFAFFFYVLGLVYLHAWWPRIGDPVTLGLLLLGVLPLAGVVDAIEIPGLAKLTFRQIEVKLQRLEAQAEPDVQRLPTGTAQADKPTPLVPPTTADTLNDVKAKLECRIRSLASRLNIDGTLSLSETVNAIEKKGKIDGSYASSLRDLIQIAAQAAHGTKMEQKAVLYVLNLSNKVFNSLDAIVGDD